MMSLKPSQLPSQISSFLCCVTAHLIKAIKAHSQLKKIQLTNIIEIELLIECAF